MWKQLSMGAAIVAIISTSFAVPAQATGNGVNTPHSCSYTQVNSSLPGGVPGSAISSLDAWYSNTNDYRGNGEGDCYNMAEYGFVRFKLTNQFTMLVRKKTGVPAPSPSKIALTRQVTVTANAKGVTSQTVSGTIGIGESLSVGVSGSQTFQLLRNQERTIKLRTYPTSQCRVTSNGNYWRVYCSMSMSQTSLSYSWPGSRDAGGLQGLTERASIRFAYAGHTYSAETTHALRHANCSLWDTAFHDFGC